MTAGAFIDNVWRKAKTEGTPGIKLTDRALLLDLVQTQCNVYASNTHCLQADNITFTPTIGVSRYATYQIPTDLGQTFVPSAFSVALCAVRLVWVDGAPLKILGDAEGRVGMSSEFLAKRYLPTYQSATNNRPVAAWEEPPNTLVFNCPFDSAYTCVVAGRKYHSWIQNENQLMDFGPEDEMPALMRCQAALLYDYSLEKAAAIFAVCERQEAKRKNECSTKQSGVAQRGGSLAKANPNLKY